MIICQTKPISISLSPNTDKQDILLALRLLLQPWKWTQGKSTEDLEQAFKEYLGASFAVSFNSGRSSLLAILSCLDLNKGDEVLLQAFTCNAVPNPVRWAGLKPVYVDCREDDYNMDVEDLERKITPKSRAVIVQHTFGLAADMDRIMEICNRRNLILIEDCAHALGATYKGKKVGTFGKAAFFSFSRDKVISCVYGGMAIMNDPRLGLKLKEYQENIGYPSLFWIKQQLLHPVLMNCLILPWYSVFGKYILVLLQTLHLFSKAVHWKEKRGRMPGYFPRRLPNALAVLVIHQLEKLEKFNIHRKELARYYASKLQGSEFSLPKDFAERENIFLRFVLCHPRAHEIIRKAWSKNLLIGDWYTSPIAPHDTKLDEVGYRMRSCPVAERLATRTLNLPTHINITQKEAQQIVNFLNNIELNDR